MHRAWRDRRKMLYGGWPTISTLSFVSNSCARPQKVGIEHHSRWRASSLETPPGVPLPPCAASIVKRWSVFCKGSHLCSLFYTPCCTPQSRDPWQGLIPLPKGFSKVVALSWL